MSGQWRAIVKSANPIRTAMTDLQPVNTMVDAGRAAAENGAGFHNRMADRCALPA